jgi:hypothetical protein
MTKQKTLEHPLQYMLQEARIILQVHIWFREREVDIEAKP